MSRRTGARSRSGEKAVGSCLAQLDSPESHEVGLQHVDPDPNRAREAS